MSRNRLHAELRLLGLVGLTWIVAIGYAALLLDLVGLLPPADHMPWRDLGLSQAIALLALGIGTRRALPYPRWGGLGMPQSGVATAVLALAGFPLLPFGFDAWWSHRHAPRIDRDDARVNAVVAALHDAPRVIALRFGTLVALTLLVDAVVLGFAAGWGRDTVLAVAVAWISMVGPLSVVVFGRARALLRPEYLGAPVRAPGATPPRTGDMRARLFVVAAVACLGVVAGPPAAGALWLSTHGVDGPAARARATAEALVIHAERNEVEAIMAEVARQPGVTVRRGETSWGVARRVLPDAQGPLDGDGDGELDVWVARSPGATAIVPWSPGTVAPRRALWIGAIAALLCSLTAMAVVVGELRRDVLRASGQVGAVAEGRAPPPLTQGSFASAEVRRLVESVDRLVQRINETNVEHYVAIERAKEADRLKSQFLANMSHDLRSPLNSVIGFSELLLAGIDGELSPGQRELVVPILEGGRHLLQQIDDILDTAKIEASRMEVHAEPVPPATLVSRAIHTARRRQRNRATYETDIAPGLPPVLVDPLRSVQALENVLLFAGERVEEGTLTITVRPGRSQDRRVVFVHVQTPVRPATAHELTQARDGFVRIPGHRGLGLGLPLAGAILELSGASLSIEDLGDGMVFTLQLPAPSPRRRATSP